ncbi:GNAT family N-acetyltransferase [Spongiactinospora gelatinilytica]|nr:GNAT family N-acetyltransferase [Spongiactinospora gelatinilytica]
MTEVVLTHHNGTQAAEMWPDIYEVYRAAFGRPPHSQAEEDFRNFDDRAHTQFQQNGFDLVAARKDGALTGFSYGHTLPSGSSWWQRFDPPLDPAFAMETGTRTFFVVELAVHPDCQRQGLGKAMLTELLRPRTEERATLASNPHVPDVQRMYERWGWEKVGRVAANTPTAPQPFFDIFLLRSLRSSGA